MNGIALWLVIGVAGAMTFALRWSFIALSERFALPMMIQRALRFVPAAVLSAIIWPAIVVRDGMIDVSADNLRFFAALAAAVVAWYTRNILYTIAAGMGTLWALIYCFG